MEDVVLHYKPGSSVDLNVLIERTEKLLGPFPCRTPPVFTTWFPVATKDHCLPIKPAKPAPIITSVGQSPTSDSRAQAVVTRPHPANKPDLIAENHHHGPLGTTTARPEDAVCISETLNRLPPSSLFTKADRKITTRSPEKHKDGLPVAVAPFKRSWSVFAQKDAVLQNLHPLSKHFHHMVSIHRLHLRQRAKWVISQHNCGAARDIEQVWRALSQSVQSAGLPTCNANIQRERAEIWVFCDVLYSEQVGQFLKDRLQLMGRINLSVHKLGNIFSM